MLCTTNLLQEVRRSVLKRLRDAVRRKRPRFWSSGDWLLHHDNAPAHSSNLVQQFLTKHKILQLRQPPYSPDIQSPLFTLPPWGCRGVIFRGNDVPPLSSLTGMPFVLLCVLLPRALARKTLERKQLLQKFSERLIFKILWK